MASKEYICYLHFKVFHCNVFVFCCPDKDWLSQGGSSCSFSCISYHSWLSGPMTVLLPSLLSSLMVITVAFAILIAVLWLLSLLSLYLPLCFLSLMLWALCLLIWTFYCWHLVELGAWCEATLMTWLCTYCIWYNLCIFNLFSYVQLFILPTYRYVLD